MNIVKVVCTTTTLSQGVNLPAGLVIIKATSCYRGAGIGYNEYSPIEIEQMIGRAGRPQFKHQGATAVIMTERPKVRKVKN
jgi:ATP-dependent DNA helicase HFM1/MER3